MERINFETAPEFEKDLKKLKKRYRSIVDDLEVVKKAAIGIYHINGIDNNSIFPILSYRNSEVISYKVKKFASKSFKGKGAKSGLRLIYIFLPKENRIILVEIYYKGNKPDEDKERLGTTTNNSQNNIKQLLIPKINKSLLFIYI